MINGFERYEEFVRHIIRTVPLLKTEQLRVMIAKYFSQPYESTEAIVFALQRNQVILMSKDGWSMTPGQYIRLTGDRFLRSPYSYAAGEARVYHLPDMNDICAKVNRPLSQCLWLIADMMPDSNDFMFTSSPWILAFVSNANEERPSRLYEITYIAKGYEVTETELLRNVPRITSNRVKEGLRRICIIEDETYAFRVPYVGFSHIVTIDHKRGNHYRIVELRKGKDRWKEDPFHD